MDDGADLGTRLGIAIRRSYAFARRQFVGPSEEQPMLRFVNPPGNSIPGISQAVVVEGGRTIFLSGHVPVREDGSVVDGGLEPQLVRVFENLQRTLSAAGASFRDVVRLTLYVRDYRIELLETIRLVRNRFVHAEQPPASTLIGVAALFHPDVLVEIEAVAALNG
jgi:2-iminobutanoate/2-iminopropanoate deaminase